MKLRTFGEAGTVDGWIDAAMRGVIKGLNATPKFLGGAFLAGAAAAVLAYSLGAVAPVIVAVFYAAALVGGVICYGYLVRQNRAVFRIVSPAPTGAQDRFGWEVDPQAGPEPRQLRADPPTLETFEAVALRLRDALERAGPPTTISLAFGSPDANILGDGEPDYVWAPLDGLSALQGVRAGSTAFNVFVPIGAYFATGQARVYLLLSSSPGPALEYSIDPATMAQIVDLLYMP